MEAVLGSPVLVALVTGVLGLLGVVVTRRFARTAQKETDTRARVDKLEAQAQDFGKRERLRDDYIHELRNHIAEEKGPPPPPWPDGLTR